MLASKPTRLLQSAIFTLGAVSTLALASSRAEACGQDAYLGQVCIMAGSYCPNGTVETNGQIQIVADNPALFSLLGCTFGGNCRDTYGMPDIRGRAPVHYGTGTGLTPRAFGTMFGEETVTQDISQMPSHSHGAIFTATGGTDPVKLEAVVSPGTTPVPSDGDYLGVSLGGDIYTPTLGSVVELGGVSGGGGSGGSVTVTNTGQGLPMDNVPPEIALRYCVVTQGLYPPRN